MRKLLIMGALACACAMPAPTPAADDLLARMASVNANLHAYSAAFKAHVQLITFPFLATDLVGTYYRKEPDKAKLEITGGLPGVASQFSKLYPHIVSPGHWSEVYEISKTGDDGTTTTYKLVPRKQGNVEHIDARVDDKTAVVSSMRWNYANGGWAEMKDSYSNVGGNQVVTAQTGHVDEPQYKADLTSTLSDYKINPSLPDSVFTGQ